MPDIFRNSEDEEEIEIAATEKFIRMGYYLKGRDERCLKI